MSNESGADFNTLYEQWVSSKSDDMVVMYSNDRPILAGDLKRQVDRYVRNLKNLGVKPGMGVGYSLPNCPEVFSLFFAICRTGAYAVPLFPKIPDAMKTSIFTAARTEVVITSAGYAEGLSASAQTQQATFKILMVDSGKTTCFNAPLPGEADPSVIPAAPHMPAMVAASSGTTGISKTVMMNRMNITSAIRCAAAMVPSHGFAGTENCSSVIAFPLATSGILVCTGILFAGVTLIFSDNLSPLAYMELAGRWKATLLSAPPSYFESILELPVIDRSAADAVRGVMTGMDFFSPLLLKRLRARFPRIEYFANGYGLIETSTVFMVAKGPVSENDKVPTDIFQPTGGCGNEVDIRDRAGTPLPSGHEGELWVRGASVVNGYLGNPKATGYAFRDGWFKTGDIARRNENQSITLLGRKKFLIKRGGKSVSPVVVQNQINKVGGVKDSAVVGVPHRLYGQMVWAFVVTDDTPGDHQEKQIMKSCRETLPNYMLPDAVRFVDALPKNPGAGKVNVEHLQKLAAAELTTTQESNNG